MPAPIVPANPPTLITTPAAFDHLAAVRQLAKLMDSAVTVPGFNVKVGLDTLLGLLPGIGDAISSAVGGYIILIASQLGAPRAVLGRMLLNQGVDMVLGVVPFVGDLLDIGWKANSKNAALLEKALVDPAAARRESAWVIAGLMAAFLAMTAGTVALTWWLLTTFVK